VRIGELSFGQNFEGFSRGVTSTTGRFSAACARPMLVAFGSVRRGRTCIRSHAVAPSDNQGVRGL